MVHGMTKSLHAMSIIIYHLFFNCWFLKTQLMCLKVKFRSNFRGMYKIWTHFWLILATFSNLWSQWNSTFSFIMKQISWYILYPWLNCIITALGRSSPKFWLNKWWQLINVLLYFGWSGLKLNYHSWFKQPTQTTNTITLFKPVTMENLWIIFFKINITKYKYNICFKSCF